MAKFRKNVFDIYRIPQEPFFNFEERDEDEEEPLLPTEFTRETAEDVFPPDLEENNILLPPNTQ